MSKIDFNLFLEELIWSLIEKNYNVDRSDPRILTYKHIAMTKNPINEIADGVNQSLQEMLSQNLSSNNSADVENNSEEEVNNSTMSLKTEEHEEQTEADESSFDYFNEEFYDHFPFWRF